MIPVIDGASSHLDYPSAVNCTLAAAVGILVLSILSDCVKASSRTFTCTFPPEKSSHVTAGDLQRVTGRLLGYRHVSSPQAQSQELANGMNGCALNLSIRRSPENTFRWELEEEGVVFTAETYQAALDGFIDQSLTLDLQPDTVTLGQTTVGAVVNKLANSRFSLLDYTQQTAPPGIADRAKWYDLGRMPKSFLEGKFITAIPAPTLDEMGISPSYKAHVLKTRGETQRLFHCLIAHHRARLLIAVRNHPLKESS